AGQHFDLVVGVSVAVDQDRYVAGDVVLAPGGQPRGELRGEIAHVARLAIDDQIDIAQQHQRGLVGQAHEAAAVDQQHAGAHAADDQAVDLVEVGDLGRAQAGHGVGFAHLPAEQVADRSDGEDRKSTRLNSSHV